MKSTYTSRGNEPDNKGEQCYMVVDGYQAMSKLFRVNSEAREAALEFYRVHLPCKLMNQAMKETLYRHGTFYFNPEYDFFHIFPRPETPEEHTLADFMYDLKVTHDPHHVGLLNLALELDVLYGIDYPKMNPSELSSGVRTAFVETLAQLHEVFFVHKNASGRQSLKFRGGKSTSDAMFNRSYPIMPMTPPFERLHRDPRPVAEDLRQISLNMVDPRTFLHFWRKLLRKWGVTPPHIEYRLLLAFVTNEYEYPIYDQEGAKRWLKLEDDAWRGDHSAKSSPYPSEYYPVRHSPILHEDGSVQWPVGALTEKYRNEDLEKAVKPAFSFWLFPIDVLGVLPEELAVYPEFLPEQVESLDMTEYWPELGLMSLPQ